MKTLSSKSFHLGYSFLVILTMLTLSVSVVSAQTMDAEQQNAQETTARSQTTVDPQIANSEIPGSVSLFFRDIGQRLQLLFTLDPVKDATKRVDFASSNLQLARLIAGASSDTDIRSRSIQLVSRAHQLIQTVNAEEQKWSAEGTLAVEDLITQTQTYLQESKEMVDYIGSKLSPEQQPEFKHIADDLTAQNTILSDFLKQKYADKMAIIDPVKVIPSGQSDRDRDGIPDTQEAELGTKSADFDTDGDGLSDRAEIEKFGTDPNNPDTDGDTFRDGYEVLKGYSPNSTGTLQLQVPATTSLKFLLTVKTRPSLSTTTLQYITTVLKNYEVKK
jgi:hypothetical protein